MCPFCLTACADTLLTVPSSHREAVKPRPYFQDTAQESESPLRNYISAQDNILTILGPRRVPAVPCPVHSTGSAISICTSVGFSQLGAAEYHDTVQALRPDIVITMADIITSEIASVKRVEKSTDRTHAWLRDASEDLLSSRHSCQTSIFAAIPPVDNVQQSLYLQDLAGEYRMLLSGLAIYSSSTAIDLPKALSDLPRICLSDPESPHTILKDIDLGVDLLTLSFVTSSSDYGIALEFDFPGPGNERNPPKPLAYDLWATGHETSLLPLSFGCDCFTCTRHHRAYVHHLLQAREMLAWTLLQIHNHAIMDRFFAGIRKSIVRGAFDEDIKAFNRNYEAELPAKTGQGPRIRGYQTKSVGGGEGRKNEKVWGKLDDGVQKLAEAESGIATPEGDSNQLEHQGFAEKA